MSAADLSHWLDSLSNWIKGLGLLLAGGLFTELRYRRQKSSTKLGEAEDSGARWHLRRQREYTESVQNERDAMALQITKLQEELTASKVRSAGRDVQFRVMKAHLAMVTRMLSEKQPERASELHSSQFMQLLDDEPRK